MPSIGTAPASLPRNGRLSAMAAGLTPALMTPAMLAPLARLAETAALVAVGTAMAHIYVPAADLDHGSNYTLAPVLAALIATSLFNVFGLYATAVFIAPFKNAARLVLGWGLALLALMACLFVVKMGSEFSRVWLMLWFVAGLLAVAVIRGGLLMVTRAARSAGYLKRTAIIYGNGGSSAALIAQLRADPNSDVHICGVFDDRSDQRTASAICDVPCLGNIDALKTFARGGHVDMLIMTLPLAAEARVTKLVHRLSELPIDVRLAAAASTLRFHPKAYSYVGSVPMIDLSERPIAGWNGFAKWLFDKVIALFAIIALAPVMAVVAAAVKLESQGPMIFRQKRYGFNNELIEVYKFRSMYSDQADAGGSKLVTRSDPRVTRVGRIIRKASLDELPQLFNVLAGTLSLVGPRPHAVQAKAADRLYPDVVDGYFARHKVKPGITGWAQINGWRGETDTPEKIKKRVEFDLAYIDNWSIWFDFCILARTPAALMSTHNAY